MLAEPFAVTDFYADGVDHVQDMRNGNRRFVLYRLTEDGRESLPIAIVVPMICIPDGMCQAAKSIGMQFAGSFHWMRPH
jgi:hypothetical protein